MRDVEQNEWRGRDGHDDVAGSSAERADASATTGNTAEGVGPISGRVEDIMQPPGAAVDVGRGASAPVHAISGHPLGVLGADSLRAAAARKRQEDALRASHSRIAQSLADHAERVSKKARLGEATPRLSAASRIAAIRERLAARSAAIVSVDAGDHGATVDIPPRVARCSSDASSASLAAAAGLCSNSGVGLPADVANAATFVAQHGVARGPVGEDHRLSD